MKDRRNHIHLVQKLEKVFIIAQMSQLATTSDNSFIFSDHRTSEVLNRSNISNAKRGAETISPKSQL
jgi:hypothetical protein